MLVTALSFIIFAATVFFQSQKSNAQSVETKRYKPELFLKTEKTESISVVGFSSDGRFLAASNNEGEITLWNLEKREQIRKLSDKNGNNKIATNFLSFSSDGSLLAGGGNTTISIFKTNNGVERNNLTSKSTSNASLPLFSSVAISPDNKFLIVAYLDGKVEIFDIASRRMIMSLLGNLYFLNAISLSPDGYMLATASANEIRFWDLTTGKQPVKITTQSPVTSISFSFDSRTVVTSHKDKKIRKYNLEPETGVWKLEENYWQLAEIPAFLAFNGNGKILAIGSQNNVVQFLDVESKKEIGRLVIFSDKDWVFLTSKGFFDASDDGEKFLGFKVGKEEISLEQLKTRRTPNLLAKFLNGEELPQVSEFSITLYPEVKINQAKPTSSTLELKLINRGGGIGRVEVRANGSEIISDARTNKDINSKAAIINLSVPLPKEKLRNGNNKIEVIVWNLEGDVRSQSNEIFLNASQDGVISKGSEIINLESEKPPSEINFYAIVSGISDYAGSEIDLRYASKDAEDISKAISLAARRYFCNEELLNKKPCKRVHLRLLSTEKETQAQFAGLLDVPDFKRFEPSKQNFKEIFAEVAKNSKPEDVVLIYLSGHGTAIISDEAVKESAFPDMYLYATQEAATLDRMAMVNQTERETKTVSSLELARWVFDIKADKKVMVFDTCAAEAVQKDLGSMTKTVDALQERSIDRLRERTGLFILMGSASNAFSYEVNQYRQGLLTYSLIEAMITNKNLRDGKFLDIENWFAFAEDRVEDLAKGIGGIQRPSFFKSNFAKSFDIGRIESDEQKDIPLARRVPLILQPELREKDKFTDKERLTEKLEARLVEQSIVLNRGESTAINYIKATSAANGFSPRGFYTLNSDGTISLEVSLISGEEEMAKVKVKGNKENIIEALLQEIIKAAKGQR